MLRVVIVDDEALSLGRLELALEGLRDVEVVGKAPDGRRGLELIRTLKPDLAFLDIRMPGLSGLEVAQSLTDAPDTAVVFVTAFAGHAVEAFELQASDYLLKPVEFERVRASVERARERTRLISAERRADEYRAVIDALRDEAAEAEPEQHARALWVTDARGRTRITVNSIEWFEAERDYVRIHTGGRTFLMRGTLQGLLARLDPNEFMRTHRSSVVRIKAIESLRRSLSGGAIVRMQSGAEAPVARSNAAALRARLGLTRAQLD